MKYEEEELRGILWEIYKRGMDYFSKDFRTVIFDRIINKMSGSEGKKLIQALSEIIRKVNELKIEESQNLEDIADIIEENELN